MPNLRIVSDNAADRGMIAASTEAELLVATNLRSNLKSQVWRATEPKASIVCQWDTLMPVGCVALAFTNWTALAKMRVRGWKWADDLYPEFDTGLVIAAPGGPLGTFGWGSPLGENFYRRGGASLYAYGYGGYGVVWVPGGRAVRKLEIYIDDSTNPDTYIEAGRLIVGGYWSPRYNFDFNHSVQIPDASKGGRTEAGDLRHERGAKWRRIEMSLSNLKADDRAALLRIARMNGITDPVFVSLFPENEDKLLEQSYQLWGKFMESGRIANPRYDIYASSLTFEEM